MLKIFGETVVVVVVPLGKYSQPTLYSYPICRVLVMVDDHTALRDFFLHFSWFMSLANKFGKMSVWCRFNLKSAPLRGL